MILSDDAQSKRENSNIVAILRYKKMRIRNIEANIIRILEVNYQKLDIPQQEY